MSTGAELLKLLKTHEKYKGLTDYHVKKAVGSDKGKIALVADLRKEALNLGLINDKPSTPKKSKTSKPSKARNLRKSLQKVRSHLQRLQNPKSIKYLNQQRVVRIRTITRITILRIQRAVVNYTIQRFLILNA